MRFSNYVKAMALAASALWLSGCASTGGESTSSTSMAKPEIAAEEVVVETTPVIDPAVQAVIDSGKVQASASDIEQMLDQSMFRFGFDSSKLSQKDYTALDAQAAYLNSPEGQAKHIIIQGHTDERGTRTYNLALGERRANAVKNYLVSQGVASSRIEVISFGFEKPLDPAHTEAAYAKNRRAHIIID